MISKNRFSKNTINLNNKGKGSRKIPKAKNFLISVMLVLVNFIILLIKYKTLPSKIPLHYNLYGVADRWGLKESFGTFFQTTMMIPIISLAIIGFFYIVYRVSMNEKEIDNVRNLEEIRIKNENNKILNAYATIGGSIATTLTFMMISFTMCHILSFKWVFIADFIPIIIFLIYIIVKSIKLQVKTK